MFTKEDPGAMVWQLLDSRGIGGIETHVQGLSDALRDIGIATKIVRINDYGEHPVFGDADASAHIALKGVADTIRRICFERPRLVHTHGYKAGIIGRLAARASGVPSVSTFHAGDRGVGLVRAYTFLDEATSRLSPAMAVSELIRQRLPHARYAPNFVAKPTSVKTFDNTRKIFGFVGRFSEEKGVDRFCALARACPDLNFVAFGDGPMRAAMETVANGRVHFAGVETDQNAIWRTIDVVCLPSRAEGLPMTALEAAARGVPILASPVGGLPDLLSEGGGWCVEFDHARWLERLRRINELPGASLACVGAAGRTSIENRFSPSAGLETVLSVYAEAGVRFDQCQHAA